MVQHSVKVFIIGVVALLVFVTYSVGKNRSNQNQATPQVESAYTSSDGQTPSPSVSPAGNLSSVSPNSTIAPSPSPYVKPGPSINQTPSPIIIKNTETVTISTPIPTITPITTNRPAPSVAPTQTPLVVSQPTPDPQICQNLLQSWEQQKQQAIQETATRETNECAKRGLLPQSCSFIQDAMEETEIEWNYNISMWRLQSGC
jgi:hypothetical protein